MTRLLLILWLPLSSCAERDYTFSKDHWCAIEESGAKFPARDYGHGKIVCYAADSAIRFEESRRAE